MTQTTNPADFASQFQSLTGKRPLRWQKRLFDRFRQNDIPPVIDLPTGLGKTMVMAIWLIARSFNKELPRRLIYVVDRRTVVDQATDEAIELQKGVGENNLVISTLRGQRADNREWSRDPSLPAIIIGTVDLIGSALLFSGYRSSYKRRPLEAGLLGQDSLLVLDEAHLSKPFEKLICAISDTGAFQKDRVGKMQGQPMRVVRMSATSSASVESKTSFTLQIDPSGNLTGEDAHDEVVTERFRAKKRLTLVPLGEKDDLNKKLVENAILLADKRDLIGKRIVVFVRKPADAMKIADFIRKHKPTKAKSEPYADCVRILTGTMRGLERDKFVDEPVFKERWLNGELGPSEPRNQEPVFLVSTSAGEVGFDLNADHLVGDATTLDSWIQRLGRVNRRGNGDAAVILIKEKEPAKKSDFDKACIAASDLLSRVTDVSPKALEAFKKKLSAEQIEGASSPKPKMVELTDILLDAWSMTSVTERMPGRPEVAPWLRGIDDDLPQTTIAWRTELDLAGFDQLGLEDIEEWYDTHGIRTHETLSVPTSEAAKWFAARWDKLDHAQQSLVGARPIVVDRAGLRLVSVKELIEQLTRKNKDSILNAELILPASFGGIERGVGLLDSSAPHQPTVVTDVDGSHPSKVASPDVADVRGRYRELELWNEQGGLEKHGIGLGRKPANPTRFALELESRDDSRVLLVSYVPKREKPEWGTEEQSLGKHVGLVRQRIDEILSRVVGLPEPLILGSQLAADYHDHGKNRERWQRTVNGVATPPGTEWSDQTLGKSGGDMKRDARHYRHEFGSIREFIDAHRTATFTDSKDVDITQEVIDLALHLIATHHGRGRPHFPKGGFDPDAERRSVEIHTDAIRRFARLQRKYGWWRLAWLENLLRCADALASGGDA